MNLEAFISCLFSSYFQYFQQPIRTHHQDSIIMGVGYLQEAVVVLFMGVEDHQEGEANLWEEVMDL
jgi:hypothetical protein